MLHTFLEIFRKTLKDDVIILNLQVMEQAQKKMPFKSGAESRSEWF